LRIEEYDKEGKLAFVNVRTGIRANPALGDPGFMEAYKIMLPAALEARIETQE